MTSIASGSSSVVTLRRAAVIHDLCPATSLGGANNPRHWAHRRRGRRKNLTRLNPYRSEF